MLGLCLLLFNLFDSKVEGGSYDLGPQRLFNFKDNLNVHWVNIFIV